MSGRANAKLNPFSGEVYVRKIEMVCDMHQIALGSQESLAFFIRALDDNKQLAIDFWSLVESMRYDEQSFEFKHARDTDNDAAADRKAFNGCLLETIIEGITGQSITEMVSSGGDALRSVSDLANLLAAKDVHAPAVSPTLVPPGNAAATLTSLPVAPTLSFAEMKRIADAEAAVEMPSPVRESASQPATESPSGASDSAAHTISRHGELKRSVVRSVLPPVGKLVQAHASSATLPRAPIAKTENNEVGPLSILTQTQKESSGTHRNLRVALWITLAMVALGGGLFAAQHYGMEPWKQFTAGRQKLGGDSNQQVVGKAVPSSRPPFIAPAAPPFAAASPTVAVTPTVAAAPTSSIVDQTKNPGRDAADSKPKAEEVLSVPHSIMQANLISSRAPIYPEEARQNGTQGRVVLQVIVSKDGTIRHLRVVAGDPALRSAAIEAVAKWRYRPYLVNGEPVDVSTLVTVDIPMTQ